MSDEVYSEDVLKAVEESKKRGNVRGFLRSVDKRIIILSVCAMVVFVYLWWTKKIDGVTFLILGGFIVTLFFLLGSREVQSAVIPFEQVVPLLERKLNVINNYLGRDVDVRIDKEFVLHSWEQYPTRYEIRFYEADNKTKREKTFTIKADAYSGNIVKITEHPSGWSSGDIASDVIVKTRYMSDWQLARLGL